MEQMERRNLHTPSQDPLSELEQLRQENQALKQVNQAAFGYIRTKVDALLEVIGTKTLKPEELDDQSLIAFDPIGIVSQTFQHVLDNLRETNSKLHFAHQEIQAIFDTVGAALLVLDPQRRVIAFNQKTKALLLEGNQEIFGCDCREVVCMAGNDENVPCIFEKVLATRREQHFQEWNSRDRCYQVIGRPMFDSSGEFTHVVLAYTDITARRNAEDALLQALNETQDANAKIHGILRSASDGMLVTDGVERIVLCNHRAEKMFGLHLSETADSPNLEQIPCPELVGLIRQAEGSSRDLLTDDLKLIGSGEQERIYQARVTPLRAADGGYRGCITFLHDVTQQREVDRMKSDFVSTAAHELRTPLATIIGYSDLLLTGDPDVHKNLYDYLRLIQDKAERLADIVGDLLDISRIESGGVLELSLKPLRIDTLCQDVVENFKAQSSRHQFLAEFPADPPVEVVADRFAMTQVLENILSNAVKYSPDGGVIRLSACQEQGGCRLSVRDQGIGMRPDQLEKIYDKFYRADATNTAIPGTGLGMTIVRHLVEAQQGQVKIESLPNQGTTVHVCLPLAAGSDMG
ncbi:MAG: hypothetical protein C0614_06375 [Desulfuromonas sp.]|nr:MAG: hypothetical protein C0614_06375 [Desulfuromonas sp.]